LSGHTDVFFERLGCGFGVIVVDAFEPAVAVGANPIGRKGLSKSIYRADRLRGRTWRVHECGMILGQHISKCVVYITWEFDRFMVGDEMGTYFAVVDAASALHTYEG